MNAISAKQERKVQLLALGWLLLLGTLALVGPFGLLAWGEQGALLEQRRDRIVVLREEKAVLENRVDLLDPHNVDPDLSSELVRLNLNVVHPDEYVIDLDQQP
jgi:cell division protein FtsB